MPVSNIDHTRRRLSGITSSQHEMRETPSLPPPHENEIKKSRNLTPKPFWQKPGQGRPSCATQE